MKTIISKLWRSFRLFFGHPDVFGRVLNIVMTAATIILVWYTSAQVEISRQASYKQLRPYLSVSEPTFRKDTIDGGIRLAIRNSSSTPAYNVRTTGTILITNRPDTLPDPTYFPLDTISRYIAPQSEVEQWISEVRGEATDHMLLNERIFVIGRLTYEDAFKHSHWVNFCFHYIHRHKKFFPHIRLNDADREN